MAGQGKKTKIVLDADVIIHFAKGGKLDMLPKILPEYQFMVLDVVKKELPLLIMSVLQKAISQVKTVVEEVFGKTAGEAKGITYLTTCDFLYYAIQRGLMTKAEADAFIAEVRSMGSFPPVVDFDTYVCTKI